MEITPQQKKILLVTIIIVAAVVALLFIARFFSMYLSTRVPGLTPTFVGGKLRALPAGQHTLEFRAKTSDGHIITDTVTFKAETDVYSNDDPYASPTPTSDGNNDPYASSTPTPSSSSDPYSS